MIPAIIRVTIGLFNFLHFGKVVPIYSIKYLPSIRQMVMKHPAFFYKEKGNMAKESCNLKANQWQDNEMNQEASSSQILFILCPFPVFDFYAHLYWGKSRVNPLM